MRRTADGRPSSRASVYWLLAPSSARATSLLEVTSPSAPVALSPPSEGVHGVLEVLALGDRRLADLPGRHLHVLLAQDADHVAGRQVPRLELIRVQPDAHAVVLLPENRHV